MVRQNADPLSGSCMGPGQGWVRLPCSGGRMRSYMISAVVAAAVLLTSALALPASASGPASAGATRAGWSVTPSPNPVVPTGQLFWVSCPSAHRCMAVGTYVKASGAGVTLAEQWKGRTWRIVPTPSPRGLAFSGLLGVSCTGPSACMAVGSGQTRSGAARVFAERWNGTSWSLQVTPSPAHGGAFLNGVACTSATACTAVGSSNAGTLAERWNGTGWSIQHTPNPAQGGASLSGVSCTSASACTAVGLSNAGTLAERWNGTRWSIQHTPNPAQGNAALTSVACTTARACTAVGASNAGTLAEAWNGTRWSIQATPNPPRAQSPFLNSVACSSAVSCTAVGGFTDSSDTSHTLAEHWNGSSWRRQPTPDQPPGGPSLLLGLDCASAKTCTAVGYSNVNDSPAVIVERFASAHWSAQRAPNPLGAASSQLNGTACTSRTDCIAVGAATTGEDRLQQTLAERWNGSAWSIQPIPSPPGGGALNSVFCTSRSACVAVGATANGRTLAEQRTGARWRILATPNPPSGGILNGVSCTSSSACTAVGQTGGGRTLAERWNGFRWRIQPTPSPSGAPIVVLASVACASPEACMATGGLNDNSNNVVGTLAERWNGRHWRILRTFKPHGFGAFLGAVACTSPSTCTAVGSSGEATTLAEHWNGVRWRVQPTPNPHGGQTIFLTSVACPASSICTSVGLNIIGQSQMTLAERFNGRGWHIQRTPGIVSFDTTGPTVACPTVRFCVAVAGFSNNGPHVTLAEQWNRRP